MHTVTIWSSLLVLALLPRPVFAFDPVPERITFQGTIASIGGGPVPNGPYGLRAEIFELAVPPAQGTETALYTQDITTQVMGGAYSITLNPATPGSLHDALAGAPRYLQVTVISGPEPMPQEVLLPRQQLAAVPYAMHVSGGTVPELALILWDQPQGDENCDDTPGPGECPCGYVRAAEFDGILIRGADVANNTADIPNGVGTSCTGAGCSGGNPDAARYDDTPDIEELAAHAHDVQVEGYANYNEGNPTASRVGSGSDAGSQGFRSPVESSDPSLARGVQESGGGQPHYHPFRTVLFCRKS